MRYCIYNAEHSRGKWKMTVRARACPSCEYIVLMIILTLCQLSWITLLLSGRFLGSYIVPTVIDKLIVNVCIVRGPPAEQ